MADIKPKQWHQCSFFFWTPNQVDASILGCRVAAKALEICGDNAVVDDMVIKKVPKPKNLVALLDSEPDWVGARHHPELNEQEPEKGLTSLLQKIKERGIR